METIRDLQTLRESEPTFPPVLFVHSGTESQGAEVIGDLWPEARAIADPDRQLYEAIGLRRGTVGQVFGPKVWWRTFLALLKGHRQRRVLGDARVMPGMFLIRSESIVWMHEYAYNGDKPEYGTIPRDSS
jgi:hypothetical protein